MIRTPLGDFIPPRDKKPLCYYIYGEISDVVAVCPYEIQYYRSLPQMDSHFFRLAKKASEPNPIYAIPEAFMSTKPGHARRFPTPEELRLVVYEEISEGAKGVMYFAKRNYRNVKGYNEYPSLEQEIGQINRGLRVIAPLLLVGDVVDLAETDAKQVKVSTILCGHDALLVFVINRNCANYFGSLKAPFSWTPKNNVRITVCIPDWMRIEQAYALTEHHVRSVYFERKENDIEITIEKLDLVHQLILLTNKGCKSFGYQTNAGPVVSE